MSDNNGGDGQSGGQQQDGQNAGQNSGQQNGGGDGQQNNGGQNNGSQANGQANGQSNGQQSGDGQQNGQQQGGDPPKGDWPEDWREKWAEGDEKFLETLKRYASPLAVRDAFREQRKALSQRPTKPTLPENPTPEQVAAYRKEIGVPEAPDKYDVSLGDGHVWGDADKPLLESFTKAAHEANLPAEAVKPMLAWYDRLQKEGAEKTHLADATFKKANVDQLAGEWGAGLNMEVRIAEEFFDSLPDGLGDLIRDARGPDGRLLGANAGLIRWANRMQREMNPAATVLPGSGINSLQAAEGRIAEIEKLMRDNNSAYWKGEKITKNGRTDTKLAIEYNELLQAREKYGKKAA